MPVSELNLNRPPTADEASGIAWWNILKPSERAYWLTRVGPACSVAGAWAAFKRHQAGSIHSSPQDTP
ncbi:hypothetical protein CDEF62S_00533 [Castellaniella defragrans]